VLFVVTGPSGCGKSTLIRRVLRRLPGLRFSISHTTRPPREREVNGRDYYFVGRDEFQGMVDAGAFVEWAVVHGHAYGTSKTELESRSEAEDVVLDIDVQGARQVKGRGLGAEFIFVVPPRFDDLRARLEKRGQDSPDVIRRRLETAIEEVGAIPEFDDLVINDRLKRAVEDLASIIRAGRCRVSRRPAELEAVLRTFREARLD
jgi:guanylate kinase